MKTLMLKAGIAVALSATLFTSCEKSDSDVAAPAGQRKFTAQEIMSHPQVIQAYNQMKAEFEAKNPDARVEFIAPWFTSDGFGLSKDLVFDFSGPFPTIVSGQFAFFGAELDANDYYRVNNDGTISVHVSSNAGVAEHYDIASGVSLTGTDANVSMNYTGPVVSFDITDENGNVIFTIRFIDIFNNPRATTMHGNATVSENGTGAAQKLVGRWVCNPGWTQANIGFELR
jgi:ABC-type glycerol-3-phosphate transport system substrate-binding protein